MANFKYVTLLGSVLLSTGALAQTFTGELEVLVTDNFSAKKTTTIYKLQEGNETFFLNIPPDVSKHGLLTGDKVIIEGDEVSNLQKRTINVRSIIKNSTDSKESTATSIRRVVAILVDFNNMKATSSMSPTDVDNILYKNTRSVQQNYKLSTFGQIGFNPDTNKDGKSDIYTIKLNSSVTGCDPYVWAADVKKQAAAAGINLSLYQHLMMVVPQTIPCDWEGLGDVGCGSQCYTWLKAMNPNQNFTQSAFAHELGHNLGMQHSSTDPNNDGKSDSNYGDAACIMGNGDSRYYKELNAPHRDQMHWFDQYPNRIKTVSADGNFTLYPLESGVNANGLLVLKMKKNATQTYYVSYRKNIGPFGPGAPVQLDKVSIHYTKAGDNHTYFIKALATNEKFVDATNNVTITALSAGGNTATVSVDLAGGGGGGGGNYDYVYPDGIGSYKDGTIVLGSDKKRYQCKPWPYTPWCSGSPQYYEPGKGLTWQDAWILLANAK